MYTPINSQVYCAAFAGAYAGMTAGGKVPASTNTIDYDAIAAVAGAFAESFDTNWNDATGLSVVQTGMIEELSQDTWGQRSPMNTVANDTAATWDSLTLALIAAVQSADTYLSGQTVTSPIYLHDGANGIIDGLGFFELTILDTGTGNLTDYIQNPTLFHLTATAATGKIYLQSQWVQLESVDPIQLGTPTQVTRGAGGAATALPANPLGYLRLSLTGGTAIAIPYYNEA